MYSAYAPFGMQTHHTPTVGNNIQNTEMKYLKLTLILILTLSCKSKTNMDENQKRIIESYIDSYNNFDINGMVENLDQNIVFENISNGNVDLRTEGINEFKEQAKSAQQYFKQRKQTITSWNFNNSIVSININYKAILATDLPNGMKSGDTLELKGKSVFEFENGKVKILTDKS